MYPNDNVAYAFGRLVGTIIRHEGSAVEVLDVREDGNRPLQIKAISLLKDKAVVDSIDNFDLTPVKLGWVNNYRDVMASYYTRAPIRQDWRQGFRQFNARVFYAPGKGQKIGEFDKKAVAKTIEGQFPPFGEVVEKLKALPFKEYALSWCRDFALTGNGTVLYKMYGKVGDFKDGTILLDEKFVWVEESLKEVY